MQPHEDVTSFLGVWGHMVLRDLASTVNSGKITRYGGLFTIFIRVEMSLYNLVDAQVQ
jgi:hypothetical protein